MKFTDPELIQDEEDIENCIDDPMEGIPEDDFIDELIDDTEED